MTQDVGVAATPPLCGPSGGAVASPSPAKPAAANAERRFTVGFIIRDNEAFDDFWRELRTAYRYDRDGSGGPVQAYAFSLGDMFAEQDAIDTILSSDLDSYEKLEAIADIPCNADLPGLLAEWGVEPASVDERPKGQDPEEGLGATPASAVPSKETADAQTPHSQCSRPREDK